MPIMATIAAVGGSLAGTGAGLYESNQQQNTQQKGLQEQNQIAQQELAGKQQAFGPLSQFYQQYMGQGSPFLSQAQTASAQQNQNQFGSAAGTLRNQMQTSGLGYGPSGATAAGLGGLAGQSAATGAGNYLQNLLNNENLKFQAAQGLTAAGNMIGGSQNQPNVSANIPGANLGSAAAGAGGSLAGLINNASATQGNQVPDTSSVPSNTGSLLGGFIGSGVPVPTGAPPTQGYS